MENRVNLLIFDFDGVLVNTQHDINKLIWIYVFHTLKVPISFVMFQENYNGASIQFILEGLTKDYNLKTSENLEKLTKKIDIIVGEKLHKKPIYPIDGVVNLLERTFIQRCVASNCDLFFLNHLLTTTGLAPFFGDFVFSAEMVSRPKPYPDLFLFVLERMSKKASESLVIEDSEIGIKAAVAANIRAYGFVGSYPENLQKKARETLFRAGARLVFSNMHELFLALSHQ